MEKYYQVAIGIPTMDSCAYIYNYLKSIVKMIKDSADTKIKYQIYICLNGLDKNKNSEKEIQRFIFDNSEIDCHLLISEIAGKNNALNMILSEASKECDIIHFLDDDVKLNDKAILNNILELIEKKEKYKISFLVGSSSFAVKHSFSYFFKKKQNLFLGLKEYFFYRIFSLPFEEESVQPNFCLGGSLCFFIQDFNSYPPDKMGIADDGYVGNYFAIQGKRFYSEKEGSNIIKSSKSKMYFEIATSYKEWLRQQIRIYVGVYYSYLYFGENLEYFREIFSWKYSVGKDFRGFYVPEKTLSRKIRLFILRGFQKKVYKESKKLIKKNQMPDWAIAKSTKKLSI